MYDNISIIISSLDPDDKLYSTVRSLLDAGFSDIIVVNDGTEKERCAPFDKLKEFDSCTLLCHDKNYGKGAALKTAFKYCIKNRPLINGVITVDGDGQHLASDVVKIANRLKGLQRSVILGKRDFSSDDVPRKSKVGNIITSTVFRLLCGLKISDTQTGLRGITSDCLTDMLSVSGSRYEYETNMLLALPELGIVCDSVRINTVYINENSSTHFRVVRDSVRIYMLILKFAASSLTSSVLDLLLFYIASLIFGNTFGKNTIVLCTVIARVISAVFNYILNKNIVFRNNSKSYKIALRFFILSICQMTASALLVNGLSLLTGLNSAGITTVFKIIVDTALFFASFRIQKNWVFKKVN